MLVILCKGKDIGQILKSVALGATTKSILDKLAVKHDIGLVTDPTTTSLAWGE